MCAPSSGRSARTSSEVRRAPAFAGAQGITLEPWCWEAARSGPPQRHANAGIAALASPGEPAETAREVERLGGCATGSSTVSRRRSTVSSRPCHATTRWPATPTCASKASRARPCSTSWRRVACSRQRARAVPAERPRCRTCSPRWACRPMSAWAPCASRSGGRRPRPTWSGHSRCCPRRLRSSDGSGPVSSWLVAMSGVWTLGGRGPAAREGTRWWA